MSLRCGCAFFLEKLAIIKCRLSLPENVARQLTFGYDEISQTGIHISKSPGEEEGLAEIERGNGIVSVHRIKTLFCDDCIRDVLNAVKNQSIGELAVYDTEKNIFYPVEDGTEVLIGDYTLEIKYKDSGYEIAVRPASTAE